MASSPHEVSRVFTKDELCLMERKPDACAIVIFGASGDLAGRKLLPALFALSQENLLPEKVPILGAARTAFTDEQFRARVETILGAAGSPAQRQAFLARCTYVSGDYDDPRFYAALRDRLVQLDQSAGLQGRRIFHLSTPPSVYESIVARLGESGLSRPARPSGWVRLVVEKPFGRDLDSALRLSATIRRVFQPGQIFRIDHYLGKETVQNILMFRFANAIFEPVWNQKYIDHVQITAAETHGVGHRAGYYEQAGAVRDMFQNHLFQLLSLVAMEPPASLEPDALWDEKGKVIAALRPWPPEDVDLQVVRGQYASGSIDGLPRPGYRQDKGVHPDSIVETYAAMRLEIDNWRWQGVPFYLRSGKAMACRSTEITVQFKHVPTSIFKPLMAEQLSPNALRFRLQPNEGIALTFEAKHPGPKLCMSTVTMHFGYEEAFHTPPPEAYTRLLLDVMLGDQTLFSREDWLTHSWGFLTPLLHRWAERGGNGLLFYPAGSWGPADADALLARDGRRWLNG